MTGSVVFTPSRMMVFSLPAAPPALGLPPDKADSYAEAMKAGMAKNQPIPRAGIVDDIAKSATIPEVRRLLGLEGDMGKALGVDNKWAYNAIKTVGNFGEMWNRRALDERSRRWLTLVGVCESCAEVPIKSHIYAAMASGNCKPAEMQEFVLAYGIHAGWPKASVIQSAVFAMTRNFEAGLGWAG